MLEDEKRKEVRTYADVVSIGTATYRLSNGEEVSKEKILIDKISILFKSRSF